MSDARPMIALPDTNRASSPRSEYIDAALDGAVAGMRPPGWRVLRDCVLDAEGEGAPARRIAFALIHARVGVALLDVLPCPAAPDAPGRLRRMLDAAGFAGVFGAYPPIVYLCVPVRTLPGLGDALVQQFGRLRPSGLPRGSDWVRTVERVLGARAPMRPAATQVAAVQAAPRAGGDGTRRAESPRAGGITGNAGARALAMFWGGLVLVVGGGVLVLHHLGPPGGTTAADMGAEVHADPLLAEPGPATRHAAPDPLAVPMGTASLAADARGGPLPVMAMRVIAPGHLEFLPTPASASNAGMDFASAASEREAPGLSVDPAGQMPTTAASPADAQDMAPAASAAVVADPLRHAAAADAAPAADAAAMEEVPAAPHASETHASGTAGAEHGTDTPAPGGTVPPVAEAPEPDRAPAAPADVAERGEPDPRPASGHIAEQEEAPPASTPSLVDATPPPEPGNAGAAPDSPDPPRDAGSLAPSDDPPQIWTERPAIAATEAPNEQRPDTAQDAPAGTTAPVADSGTVAPDLAAPTETVAAPPVAVDGPPKPAAEASGGSPEEAASPRATASEAGVTVSGSAEATEATPSVGDASRRSPGSEQEEAAAPAEATDAQAASAPPASGQPSADTLGAVATPPEGAEGIAGGGGVRPADAPETGPSDAAASESQPAAASANTQVGSGGEQEAAATAPIDTTRSPDAADAPATRAAGVAPAPGDSVGPAASGMDARATLHPLPEPRPAEPDRPEVQVQAVQAPETQVQAPARSATPDTPPAREDDRAAAIDAEVRRALTERDRLIMDLQDRLIMDLQRRLEALERTPAPAAPPAARAVAPDTPPPPPQPSAPAPTVMPTERAPATDPTPTLGRQADIVPTAPAPAATGRPDAPRPAAPAPQPPTAAVPAAPPTATAPPAPPRRQAAPAAPSMPAAMIAALVRRGDEMLALGDVSAARLLYERAANAGSAAAAVAAGRTYDPAVLSAIGAREIRPDPAAAAAWYRRAAALGDPGAATLLHRLEARAAD
jgi:hypothetical protein